MKFFFIAVMCCTNLAFAGLKYCEVKESDPLFDKKMDHLVSLLQPTFEETVQGYLQTVGDGILAGSGKFTRLNGSALAIYDFDTVSGRQLRMKGRDRGGDIPNDIEHFGIIATEFSPIDSEEKFCYIYAADIGTYDRVTGEGIHFGFYGAGAKFPMDK